MQVWNKGETTDHRGTQCWCGQPYWWGQPYQVPRLGSKTTSVLWSSLGWMRSVGFMLVWSKRQAWKHLDPWTHINKWSRTSLGNVSASHNHRVGPAGPTSCGRTYDRVNLAPPTWELTCNQPRITDHSCLVIGIGSQVRPHYNHLSHLSTDPQLLQIAPTLTRIGPTKYEHHYKSLFYVGVGIV
jgi:hypothetical protein